MNLEDKTSRGTASSSQNEPETKTSRNITRNAISAIKTNASNLSTSMRENSMVFRVGLGAMDILVSPAKKISQQAWEKFAEPVVKALDQRIDYAVNAIEEAVVKNEVEKKNDSYIYNDSHTYSKHWDSMKDKLLKSKWYQKVDHILVENTIIKSITHNLRPAEAFFNTLVETSFESGNNLDEFVQAVKKKLGPAWDDRLEGPSRVYYNAASAAKGVLGAGRFFGGVIQLGKRKVKNVMDDLNEKWESMLRVADDKLDDLIPENLSEEEMYSRILEASEFDNESKKRSWDYSTDGYNLEATTAQISEDEGASCEDENRSYYDSESSDSSGSRSMIPLAKKYTDRLKKRVKISHVNELPLQFKEYLENSNWFKSVNDILQDNKVIIMMLNTLDYVIKPAEHFYETSVEVFKFHWKSSEEFTSTLKKKMGSAWDDRLNAPAISFFEKASEIQEDL